MFYIRNVVIFLIVVGIFGFAFLMFKKQTAPIIAPIPTPTEIPAASVQSDPSPQVSEVRSPDGEMIVIMKKTALSESFNYVFSVSNKAKDEERIVFALNGTNSLFLLPQNSWSPDNKYFFIKEEGGGFANYFVFRADGEPFSADSKYIDVAPLFTAQETGFELSDVTGWASPTLLYLLTKGEDGSRGPTYWLEIPSLAIIRLADR